MPNYNVKTGIPFGYISASALDSDIVDSLIYGNGTTEFHDISWQEACEQGVADYRRSNLDESEDLADSEILDIIQDDLAESMGDSEIHVEGIYGNVHYATSWLGGALNFFIFESPYVTNCARKASPCVPNAAILDTLDGTERGYDVPPEWRRCED